MAFDPKMLGDKLIVAGDEQVATGNNLGKSANNVRLIADVFKGNGQLDRSLGSVENGMRATRNLLTSISSTLNAITNVLNDISVPTIEFQTQSVDLPVVGRIRFISSFSVAAARPFCGAAGSIMEQGGQNSMEAETALEASGVLLGGS